VTNNIKLLILSLLVLQNATQTLVMRYSRGVLSESYNPTAAVILTELTKLLVCVALIALGIGDSGLSASDKHASKPLPAKIAYLIRHSGYTWVPAACYLAQNSLLFVASANLSSSVYAVLQQMKILSAALCSVCLLRRHLLWRQWRALLLLVVGGLLMEYHTLALSEEGQLTNNNDPIKGGLAMLCIVALSGVAGVMTELLLKNKRLGKSAAQNEADRLQLSIWDRNIQLSFWSLVLGGASVVADGSLAHGGGLLHGFSAVTALVVAAGAAGAVLVAMTIKYTDVIIKGFASAISLILICFGGALFLGDYLDMVFLVGATVTIIATFNYNDKEGMAGSDVKLKTSAVSSDRSESTTSTGDRAPEVVVVQDEERPLKNTSD